MTLCGVVFASAVCCELPSIGRGDYLFQLDDVNYLSTIDRPEYTLKAVIPGASGVLPLTKLTLHGSVVTGDDLQAMIKEYSDIDDVFGTPFLRSVHISTLGSTALDKSATDHLSSMGTEYLFVDKERGSLLSSETNLTVIETIAPHTDPNVPNGPYMASVSSTGVSISRVYRLYEDVYRTFLHGTYPSGPDSYQSFSLMNPDTESPLIPVPSRVYYLDDDRPLAGERVGVKDIYETKGLTATWGSLAYYKIANKSEENPPCLQRLIDLGAVVVGKQKTAQFASAADPWDWTDFQPPFNPRGDGYLTCSASSSGSACSIAAYNWLDFALGSDTGQSVRRPAAVSGIYGHRPSQGLMSTTGVMPISYSTDTLGIFSRDPYKLASVNKLWYKAYLHQNESTTHLPAIREPSPDTTAFPRKLLYAVDFLPMKNPDAQVILDKFLKDLTVAFNITMVDFNFSQTLEEMNVPGANNMTNFLSTLSTMFTYDQEVSVATPFLDEYAAKFKGAFPPLDKQHRAYFHDKDAYVTSETHTQALQARRKAFDVWDDRILHGNDETCSETMIVYDIGFKGLPSFREYSLNQDDGAAFLVETGTAGAGGNICPFFGCADMTVPIGQVTYYSNVTFTEVNLPVTASLAVRRGCDAALWNMVEKMADLGIVSPVKAGTSLY
ncbi:Amidase [Geosmithia morbida]|uniref:Amidase n=1 Tax=Geosmithia morbida TaxID=1094350 RepID=A0A9P4YY43_9HYPO|nr:Amidase [Geosmithia morbida]KAF4124180.1 Amidase [Geosmithia morbida]